MPTNDSAPQNGFPFAPTARKLLRWYERKRRDLPWRESSEPYSVWVSEVMLQQTRVDVVVDRFRRFLDRFPTIESLAEAEEDEVLAEWSGLGYYRRARALHRGARAIVAEHGGRFPREMEDAMRLPGVGRYTAGAVLSISYNLPVPAVDGNVERVVLRLLRWNVNPKVGRFARQLRDLVLDWIPSRRASEFNQALMELGATVCTPRAPRCEACPVATVCRANLHGETEELPKLPARSKTVPVRLQAAVIERHGRFLLQRVEDLAYLKGLWLFPFVEAPDSLRDHLARRLGITLRLGTSVGTVRHSITFRRITLEAFRVTSRDLSSVELGADLRWAKPEELGRSVAVSSLVPKVLGLLGRGQIP